MGGRYKVPFCMATQHGHALTNALQMHYCDVGGRPLSSPYSLKPPRCRAASPRRAPGRARGGTGPGSEHEVCAIGGTISPHMDMTKDETLSETPTMPGPASAPRGARARAGTGPSPCVLAQGCGCASRQSWCSPSCRVCLFRRVPHPLCRQGQQALPPVESFQGPEAQPYRQGRSWQASCCEYARH